MADIIYTYKNEVYANITNKCDCACTFCIRSQKDAIGDATTLWHKVDPTYDEIIAAIDAFDFTGYEEFVFCGYGEPTCALDILEKTAKYVKEKYKLPIRVNTNGLGNLYHGRDIVPELSEYIDSVSISKIQHSLISIVKGWSCDLIVFLGICSIQADGNRINILSKLRHDISSVIEIS